MPLKVIYIDDEPDLCEIFYEEYGTEEIQITTYTDSKKAIEEVTHSQPDIIFLDYRLPGTTGDQIAQKMPKHIPKYLISGDQTVDSSYAFQKIFTKPVNPDEIRSVLEELLKKKS